MRVCVVYDCLFPHTVGGAERWYRNLAERLAAAGHDVTYLTLCQWPPGEQPDAPPGVRVVVAGPRMALYAEPGRRRIGPPLVFGAGVLWHLLRHGRYDVVHTASFPYFSVLAAGIVRPLRRFTLVVDWHEVWTRDYWREYLGPAGGALGWLVQRGCARVRQRAFCFSRLHAARLRAEGVRGEVTVLEGEYAGALEPRAPAPVEPLVVAAARQIPEKRIPALVHALAAARTRAPELRAELYGDGPEHAAVLAAIAEHGLGEVVSAPGFVDADTIDGALARALCMVLPSAREGYGQVVIEAAAHGTPSVVVAGADNAAVELVEEGVNGVVAPSAAPADLADAILRVREAGEAMRTSTRAWFAANARRLSMESSLETVLARYTDP